jgi:protein SCO1/2
MRALCAVAALVLLAATAPPPHLVDQTGRPFTLASLKGEPFAVAFVEAHCTDACPLIDGQFADAARRLAASHVGARLLTITLDPERDSPAAMRALARRMGADPQYWLVAGGSVPDVHRIMRFFGVYAVRGRDGYVDQHSTFVYVFDANGQLAQTTLASTALNEALVETLGKLAAQPRR